MGMLHIVAQAGALSVLSNVLAQSITNYQEQVCTFRPSTAEVETAAIANPAQKPYANLNLHETLIFVTFAVLNTPLNVYWQEWLEDAFPGTQPVAVTVKDSHEPEKPESVGAKDRMAVKEVTDYKNIAIKFALDQTVGAVFNIVLFIAGIGALKGEAGHRILGSIRRVCLHYIAPKLLAAEKNNLKMVY
jgi:protein Mpv17